MKKFTFIICFVAIALGTVYSQEPRSNSFEDFVFKTPVAYKTSYGNETHRITSISDMGPITIVGFTDEITTLADSTDVYVHPYDFLFDPTTGKRYHMVSSINIPKFEKKMYVKGKAGQSTKHPLKYMLCFNRLPADVKTVEFHHAPDWDTPEQCYASTTFYDIDMTGRKEMEADSYEWINITPHAEQIKYFTPLSVSKDKESGEGKSEVLLNLAFRMIDRESKYSGSRFSLHNDAVLYDPVNKRSYPSSRLNGFPEGEEIWLKGWDIMAFGYAFDNVDSDVDVVDVMLGDTCIIKGLHLKP